MNLNHFEENPVSETLFSFLKSKDDSLVMLILSLIDKMTTLRGINPNLLDFCRLNIKPKTKDFSSIMTIEKIVLNCLKLFTIDPPSFRICTYKQASKVLLYLSKIYQNQGIELSKDIISQARLAMKISISRITPYLFGGKQWQKVIQLYLMIQRQSEKPRKINLKTYGIIPEELFSHKQNKIKFTDQLYESSPKKF